MAPGLLGKPANGRQMKKWRCSHWPCIVIASLQLVLMMAMTRSLQVVSDNQRRLDTQNPHTPFLAEGRNESDPSRHSLKQEIAELKQRRNSLQQKLFYSVSSEAKVAAVYDTLKEVLKTLSTAEGKLKSQWFADGGTLIGALRCHPPGMMKWDDDVDLAVKTAADLEELHNLLKSNPRLQWKRHDQFLAYKYALAANEEEAYFGVEILALGLVNSKWHFLDQSGRRIEEHFATMYYKDEEVEHVVPCRFWDLTLNCPLGGLETIQRMFGKKALTEAQVYSHGVNAGRSYIKLEKENLNQHSAYFPAMTKDLMKKLTFSL